MGVLRNCGWEQAWEKTRTAGVSEVTEQVSECERGQSFSLIQTNVQDEVGGALVLLNHGRRSRVEW